MFSFLVSDKWIGKKWWTEMFRRFESQSPKCSGGKKTHLWLQFLPSCWSSSWLVWNSWITDTFKLNRLRFYTKPSNKRVISNPISGWGRLRGKSKRKLKVKPLVQLCTLTIDRMENEIALGSLNRLLNLVTVQLQLIWLHKPYIKLSIYSENNRMTSCLQNQP